MDDLVAALDRGHHLVPLALDVWYRRRGRCDTRPASPDHPLASRHVPDETGSPRRAEPRTDRQWLSRTPPASALGHAHSSAATGPCAAAGHQQPSPPQSPRELAPLAHAQPVQVPDRATRPATGDWDGRPSPSSGVPAGSCPRAAISISSSAPTCKAHGGSRGHSQSGAGMRRARLRTKSPAPRAGSPARPRQSPPSTCTKIGLWPACGADRQCGAAGAPSPVFSTRPSLSASRRPRRRHRHLRSPSACGDQLRPVNSATRQTAC